VFISLVCQNLFGLPLRSRRFCRPCSPSVFALISGSVAVALPADCRTVEVKVWPQGDTSGHARFEPSSLTISPKGETQRPDFVKQQSWPPITRCSDGHEELSPLGLAFNPGESWGRNLQLKWGTFQLLCDTPTGAGMVGKVNCGVKRVSAFLDQPSERLSSGKPVINQGLVSIVGPAGLA